MVNVIDETGATARAARECEPLVSIVVVLYNALPFLPRFVAALARQTYRNSETIIVDNASTDGSAAFIAQALPDATLIRLPTNGGFAAGNNAALRYCHGTYLALINPDTEPEPTWLSTLVAVLEADPSIGLATSKIVLTDDRATINTCGNAVHVAGFATCRGLGAPTSEYTDPEDIAAVSGAAFMIRRALMERLGGFDASFFMYVEDTDLSWRALLLGARCRFVPASVVAHRYTLLLGAEKTFYLERNRMQMLLKCYRARTLFLLAPALVLGEFAVWAYTALQGPAHLRAKAKAARWIMRHRRDIWKRRRAVQANRVMGDCVVLIHTTSGLPLPLVRPGRLMRYVAMCTTIPFAFSRRVTLIVERLSQS